MLTIIAIIAIMVTYGCYSYLQLSRRARTRSTSACLHPVSITRFPLRRFSPGAGLLRNPFVHRLWRNIFQRLGPKRRESSNGDRVYAGVRLPIHPWRACVYTNTHSNNNDDINNNSYSNDINNNGSNTNNHNDTTNNDNHAIL